MKIETKIENLKNYKTYIKIKQAVHEFFKKKYYLETEVPVLSPTLIPESYLEIFETEFNYFNKKKKLYLTPSPELFLKRLLVAGIGNCYYLGKSFRNSEPNSSWHNPEFTMLEFYKLGVDYLEMAEEVLGLLRFIKNRLKRHSGDRGDERSTRDSRISVIDSGHVHSSWTRSLARMTFSFDRWEKFSVAQAFEKFSNISEKELFDEKIFIERAQKKGYSVKNSNYADLFSQIIASEIEPKLGVNCRPTLLYDYPKQIASLAKLNKDNKTAQRCEFYMNGLEVGGFCTELNDYKEQEKRFDSEVKARKKNGLIDHSIDKGFIQALKYGLPDCTGAGIGFERLAMIFADVDSIDKLKLINITI